MISRRLSFVAAVLVALAAGGAAVPASAAETETAVARGGRLYDNWYKELKTTRPDSTHPSYPASGKSPKNSWRCNACHGWDYQGDKAMGIKGIGGAKGKPEAQIVAVLRDKTHAYTPDLLPDVAANELAMFVSKGQTDVAKFVDAAGKPKGNVAKGEVYYNSLCGVCHGADGKKVSTGMALGQASEYPAAVVHKALNGQPAEAMPMLRAFDHQVTADIVAYSQSLPK
ncbi:c-type cytochrome [Magnetospirillum moscoviense]|uniref:Cytochrome c domain-containing protein n=1 Tax=Magnetospirillum moscoviense TaxID=1437059 RepID=A0A178MXT7_9PROT|nr:c-type cytochrome [Magnetospirillum moscoviense]OAN55709.1 hypothetical protein A6A05_08110 [Magnetospirillum moscoviense]